MQLNDLPAIYSYMTNSHSHFSYNFSLIGLSIAKYWNFFNADKYAEAIVGWQTYGILYSAHAALTIFATSGRWTEHMVGNR